MKQQQLDLYDEDQPRARPADPQTSHDAARGMVESGQLGLMCQVALRLVEANPGSTAAELDAIYRRQADQPSDGSIRKRLNDLHRRAKIVRGPKRTCTQTGRQAHVWNTKQD